MLVASMVHMSVELKAALMGQQSAVVMVLTKAAR
jgi:hypothetical protein